MNNSPVTKSNAISKLIWDLHHIHGLSFGTIAFLPPFIGIPKGTIYSIYKGGRVPNKWRKQLGMPKLVKVPETRVKGEPQPPRNLTRCTFYKTTDPAKIVRDLQRVTGLMFELVE